MAGLKPTFHHLNHSQSQRILWLLEELEIPYDLVLHNRQETGPCKGKAPPEMQKIHPLGKAPTLETGDGRVIVESLVIAKYLIDTYDTTGRLKGDEGHHDAIRDDELCNMASASIGPVMVLQQIFSIITKASPFFIRPLVSTIHKHLHAAYIGPDLDLDFRYLNGQLGDQDYFGGSCPARADFILSWPLDTCTQNKFIDIARYPNLDRWFRRCHERPAWKKSLEKGNGYSLRFEDAL